MPSAMGSQCSMSHLDISILYDGARKPVLPVARFTMKMHDRKDENVVLFDAVKHPERKTMRQTPPDIGLNFGPQGWIGEGVLDCGVDFAGKIESKTRIALFIIRNAGFKLLFRLRVEAEFHVAYLA